jgi:hypothetical protein
LSVSGRLCAPASTVTYTVSTNLPRLIESPNVAEPSQDPGSAEPSRRKCRIIHALIEAPLDAAAVGLAVSFFTLGDQTPSGHRKRMIGVAIGAAYGTATGLLDAIPGPRRVMHPCADEAAARRRR